MASDARFATPFATPIGEFPWTEGHPADGGTRSDLRKRI